MYFWMKSTAASESGQQRQGNTEHKAAVAHLQETLHNTNGKANTVPGSHPDSEQNVPLQFPR